MTGALTQSDLADLYDLLFNKGDRAGFYLKYYDLTGSEQALMQAHITIYSGFLGGAALVGNGIAKLSNPTLYTMSLDVFSTAIAAGLYEGIVQDWNATGSGVLLDDDIQSLDRGVWGSFGMAEYFPGNIQIAHEGAEALISAGTFSAALAGLQVVFGERVGNDREQFQGPQYRWDDSNASYFAIYETVVDSSTGQSYEIVRYVEEKIGLVDRLTLGAHENPVAGLADEALLGLGIMAAAPSISGLMAGALLSNDAMASMAQGTFKLLWNSVFGDAGPEFDLADKFRRYLGADGASIDPTVSFPQNLEWDQLPIVLRQSGSFSDAQGASNFLVGYNDATIQGVDGDDVLIGFGSSQLTAGNGYNFLFGTDNATLNGGSAGELLAGAGDARLYGGGGSDVMLVTQQAIADGGADRDYGFAFDHATVRGGAGDDVLLGYGAARLEGGEGNDWLLHLNTQDGSPDHRGYIDGGAGNDTVLNFGASDIYLGEGDDLVLHAGSGSVIYGGQGRDTVMLTGDNVMFADADENDRISFFGSVLTGGSKWMYSENPYAYSANGLIRYGLNVENDLVIESALGHSLFIDDYVGGPGAAHNAAGIYVFEYDIDAHRILDTSIRSGYSYMNTWRLALGDLMKANFGVSYWNSVDPLVLDLDGDGIELQDQSSTSPMFDMDGDGYLERTGWVYGGDGFLIHDVNGNGSVDGVAEMFGGPGASGFAELAQWDTNGDGIISADDQNFALLRVWRDVDGDAVTDAGELLTLEQANIASIAIANQTNPTSSNHGNQITATGTFTRLDGSTGSMADVTFAIDNIRTEWVGSVDIPTALQAAPNLKGYGTLVDLHVAMALENSLHPVITAGIQSLDTLDLEQLRAHALPLLEAWASASPTASGQLALNPHNDVPLLLRELNGETRVVDYAYRDAGGDWVLASSSPVKDAAGNVIAHPSYSDVMNQLSASGESWTALPGGLLSFMERYLGESLPLDLAPSNATGAISSMTELLDTIWATTNLLTVRLAVQGPLSEFFQGVDYDAESDKFVPNTDRGLVPVYEAIFEDIGASGGNVYERLQEWTPFLKVVLGDYDRGGDFLKPTYGFIFANIVAAYESTGLPIDLAQAADALGVPDELIVMGGATITGSNEDDIIYLGVGDQVARGGRGGDTYVIGANFGHDVIDDVEPAMTAGHRPDYVRFASVASTDVTATRDGNDLIITVNGTTNELRITRQFEGIIPSLLGNDVSDETGISEIIFADGVVWGMHEIAYAVSHPLGTDDSVIGTGVMDVLDGGAGTDFLSGKDGSDIYLFGRGYGSDTIKEAQNNLMIPSFDIVQFGDGVELDDLSFERGVGNGDIRIRINGTDDLLTVQGQFAASYTGVFGTQRFDQVEAFVFQDGTYLSADEVAERVLSAARTDSADSVIGFDRDDIIDGGKGDDFLSGGNDNDTYIVGFGLGNDVIKDNTDRLLSGMTDTVRFTSAVRPEDVTFSREGGSDDLLITLSDGTVITVDDHFKPLQTGVFGVYFVDRIERFEFANGTVITYQQISEQVVEGAGTSGNDLIYGISGRNDVLDGGAGDDFLSGGDGDDVYVFGLGYGHDVIEERGTHPIAKNYDTIRIKGSLAPDDVDFSRSEDGKDLLLTLADGSTLLVRDAFVESISFDLTQVEEIYFEGPNVSLRLDQIQQRLLAEARTTGNDHIRGFYTADSLDGGAGNDLLQGGAGSDIYIFRPGQGNDTISDSSGARDVVSLGVGFSPDQVTVSRGPSSIDVQLEFATGEVLTILGQNPALGGTSQIEELRFADGTIWTASALRSRILEAEGTAGADVIVGFTGDDVLDGGAGDDLLEGGYGGDRYVYGRGYGTDRVRDVGNGARQDSCRLSHAANRCLVVAPDEFGATHASRSGLSATLVIGDQFRVSPDHRAGCCSLAC